MTDHVNDMATAGLWTVGPPSTPPYHVARPALLRTLDRAAEQPLTIVSAAAGWGKTTLLAAWANTRPVWWMAARIRGTTDATTSLQEFTRRLGHTGPPVTIVLDDTHAWTDSRPWAAVEDLLLRCPSRVRVLVGCRQDPELAERATRRARPTRIGSTRLAFTFDESVEFLAAHGIRMDETSAVSLNSTLRGWPAALRLAALAMRERRSQGADALWPQPDRTLVDYVEREVLNRLPPGLRDLALHLSVLDDFDTHTVEAVAGGSGAHLVDSLGRFGLLDGAGRGRLIGYRLHPLISLVCHQLLRRQQPEQVRRLHGRMAGWYVGLGQANAALHHSIAARDWDAVTSLVECHWPRLIAGARGRGRVEPPPAPPSRVRDDAKLALAFALERLDAGDPHASAAYLSLARAGANTPFRPGLYDCLFAAARLAQSQLADDTAGVAAASAELTSNVGVVGPAGVERVTLRVLALIAAGGAQVNAGRPARGERELRDALTLARRHELLPGQLAALRWLAAGDVARGRLTAAARAAREALALADRHRLGRDRDAAWISLTLADVRRVQRRLDASRYALARALTHDSTEPAFVAARAVVHARLRHSTHPHDDPSASLAWVRRRYGSDELGATGISMLELTEAELRLMTGDARQVRRLLARNRPESHAAWHDIVSAKLCLAENRPTTAVEKIQPYLESDDVPRTHAVEANLVYARASAALGDHHAAAASIERAVRLAGPEDIRDPFAHAARMAHRLLSVHLAAVGNRLAFARSLLAHSFPAEDARPLSAREVVIMRYLQSHLSVAEIAAALHVSTNTVRSHVKNVYRKLGVRRRWELATVRS